MTEQELEIVRAKMKAEAATIVLFAVLESLARSFPTFAPSLLASAKQKQADYQSIALSGFPPEYSDLLSAEFQDAFSDLIKLMENSLANKQNNP